MLPTYILRPSSRACVDWELFRGVLLEGRGNWRGVCGVPGGDLQLEVEAIVYVWGGLTVSRWRRMWTLGWNEYFGERLELRTANVVVGSAYLWIVELEPEFFSRVVLRLSRQP